jgi:hypothetical protein
MGEAPSEASGVTVIGISVGVADILAPSVSVAGAAAAYTTPAHDCRIRMPLRLNAMLFVIYFFIFCF